MKIAEGSDILKQVTIDSMSADNQKEWQKALVNHSREQLLCSACTCR